MTSPKTFTRRRALGLAAGAAAAMALPIRLVPAQAPVLEFGDWTPLVLSTDQARTVAIIAEAIIPRTDTPGALDARCHEFIDLLLSVDNDRNRTRFLEGLQWMDDHSVELFGSPFAGITDEQRFEILTSISDDNRRVAGEVRDGWRFFKDIKRRVIDAYYSSREGWVEELGRPETSMHRPYVGCRHSGEDHS
jgi:hypothetical protein